MEPSRAGGPALFRLVRYWSRRWASQAGSDRDVQRVLVVEALSAAGEPTIGAVAHQLGLDRSVASRMVADAAAEGYVDRGTDPADARRTVLALTHAGEALLAGARAWQGDAFVALTTDWSPADRDQFARYLARLADELGA